MPPNDPAPLTVIDSSFWGRALATVGRALRLTSTVETPREVVAGGDYAAAAPQESAYSPTIALSAVLSPYVYACVEAITSDLASLPIVVKKAGKPVDNHWLHTMIQNSGLGARVWRKASIRDQLLVGRTLSVVLMGSIRGVPVGVRWQHPSRVRPVPGADGTVIGWEVGMDRLTQYRPDQVVATISLGYQDGPEILSGIGATQVLHADLEADVALSKAAARAARAGRPAAVYSPKGSTHWAPAQVKTIKDTLAALFSASDGGVAVSGVADGQLDMLGWAPREMEGPQQKAWFRGTIMAVLGVPPVRLGVDGANTWATSEAQLAAYWTQLQGTVAPLDEALTELVRRIDRDPTLTVEHAFDGVPALQVAQTAVLDRITKHIANGMAPAAAYAYEGWEVDPKSFTAPPSASPAPPNAATNASADDESDDPAALAELGDDLALALATLQDPDASAADKAEALADAANIADELAALRGNA